MYVKFVFRMDNQNQEKSPVTWLRCFSKKKKKIYYFNTKTREAFWDGPDGIEIRDHESVSKTRKFLHKSLLLPLTHTINFWSTRNWQLFFLYLLLYISTASLSVPYS